VSDVVHANMLLLSGSVWLSHSDYSCLQSTAGH